MPSRPLLFRPLLFILVASRSYPANNSLPLAPTNRMSSARKARFKDGAAVVIGVNEGTMPVDVEDDDEDEDEDENDEDSNHGDRVFAILDRPPDHNITQVRRATGMYVSVTNAPNDFTRGRGQPSTNNALSSPLTRQQGIHHRAVLAHRISRGHLKMY